MGREAVDIGRMTKGGGTFDVGSGTCCWVVLSGTLATALLGFGRLFATGRAFGAGGLVATRFLGARGTELFCLGRGARRRDFPSLGL